MESRESARKNFSSWHGLNSGSKMSGSYVEAVAKSQLSPPLSMRWVPKLPAAPSSSAAPRCRGPAPWSRAGGGIARRRAEGRRPVAAVFVRRGQRCRCVRCGRCASPWEPRWPRAGAGGRAPSAAPCGGPGCAPRPRSPHGTSMCRPWTLKG